MRDTESVVAVVGGGIAGLRAARAASKAGASVHIFSEEPVKTYSRTSLSKLPALYNTVDAGRAYDRLELTRATDQSIHWHTGVKVLSVDLPQKALALDGMSTFYFDFLVAASGSQPRRIESALSCNVHTHAVIHCLDDCRLVGDLSRRSQPITVIGAGAIGCEFASLAVGEGFKVDLYDVAGWGPLANIVGEEIGGRLRDVYIGHGVNVISGWPSDFECVIGGCRTNIKSSEPAPLVIEALGYTPETAWLEGNGLDLSQGVQVDSYMRSISFSNLFAAGDIARYPSPSGGESSCRRVSWENAVETGTIAGQAIADAIRPARPGASNRKIRSLPVFTTEILGLRVRACGYGAQSGSMSVTHGSLDDLRSGVFIKQFSEGVLTGLVSIAGPSSFEGEFMSSLKLMEAALKGGSNDADRV